MNIRDITTIAGQELTVNIRNRWTVIFALVFGALLIAISYFGLVTAGSVGFQGFVRTSVSLLNLVIYIVPLVALTMGTLSFTSERTSGELLFAQPVRRIEVLLGKITGLFASILMATMIGFGATGIVIVLNAGGDGAFRYPLFVGLALILALIFLSLAALVATACHRNMKAFGIAIFVWFFFVVFYDLLVIGGTFLQKERTANTFLFVSLLGNPVDMIRVASLIILDGKQIFGPAGAALVKFLGGDLPSLAVLFAGLAFWIVAPLCLSGWLLSKQDI